MDGRSSGKSDLILMEEVVNNNHKHNLLNVVATVERVDGRNLSYADFVDRYLKTNRPVVLTGLMDEWRACNDWVTPQGLPNLHFISSHFGNSLVQVADCGKRDFSDQKRLEMSVSEFVAHWRIGNNTQPQQPLLYLKDWHFVKEYPEYVAYTTPTFFADDWLNMYLDSYPMRGNADVLRHQNEINCSDYRFVYMGGKGTWTPLHADVFRSYSWSANVCGKKLWYFSPPSQSHLLFDRHLKRSIYNIFDEISKEHFPGFSKTVWWECTQEKNEVIFVPSGWYHQVYNMEDTISINHNWFNGYNLPWVWSLLVRDYNEAKEYIEDIRDISYDFEGLCQRNLAANTGMNFIDFFLFITRFAFANLIQMVHLQKHEEDSTSYKSIKLEFLVYNMLSICHVASKMKSAESFSVENLHICSTEDALLSNIKTIFEESQFRGLQTLVGRTYGTMGKLHYIEHRNNFMCQKCLFLLKHAISTHGNSSLECLVDFCLFGPENLVSVIEHVMEDTDELNGGFNFSLSSEFWDGEPSIVL